MDKTLDSEKEEHFFAGSIQGQSLILLLNKLQSQGTLHTSDLSSVLLSVGIKSMIDYLHRTSDQLEMAKKYPMDFEGAMRTPSPRASRAPT